MFEEINGLYYPTENRVVKDIPNGIYTLTYNTRKYCAEAKYVGSKFSTPKKIYCLDEPFIRKVKDAFDRKDGHLGVLLNGYKGSGKSVTAKILCNSFDLPIFVLSEKIDGEDIQLFCNCLEQDCIVFIDEYEKVFGKDSNLLSLMDGALHLNCKILFLLTSNDMNISENLINRPSRILYIKQFSGLEKDQCEEIIGNFIEDQTLRSDMLEIILKFEEITIDNIMTFLSEYRYTKDLNTVLNNLNINLKTKNSNFGLNRK